MFLVPLVGACDHVTELWPVSHEHSDAGTCGKVMKGEPPNPAVPLLPSSHLLPGTQV